MHVGLEISHFTWPGGLSTLGDTFGQIAERAERAGFYSLWVMDHFFQVEEIAPMESEVLEAWTALAFAAAHTNRIKLGTLVTGVTYRHPGLLVKMATTLDVLSHGRAYFGLGAGWYEEEHRGYGIPFPSTAERFERLEETLQIAQQMWAGEDHAYAGQHYHLARPLNAPQAVQRPHPPILIGGEGERKTLRLVAQYGDACNLFGRLDRDELMRKLHVLHTHCQALGRPYAEIEKTTHDAMHITRTGRDNTLTPAAAIEYLASFAAMGIDQVIFSMPNVAEPEAFDVLASEVIPAVERLPVAGRE